MSKVLDETQDIVKTWGSNTLSNIDMGIAIMPILAFNELIKQILSKYVSKGNTTSQYFMYAIVMSLVATIYKMYVSKRTRSTIMELVE